MRLLVLVLWLAVGSAFAGEYVILASGSRLRIDRHETAGARIRLYNGSGYTEMAAADVRGFEPDEPAPAQPPAAAVQPADTAPAPSPQELADAAADKYGLPRQLVRSVMAAESGFLPDAVSAKGAIGLMQLMPDTARELGIDPRDPAQNVEAGVHYLRDLLDRYGWRLWHALAAYNAGPAAVDKYGFVPPYRETIDYVIRIDRALKAAASTQPPPETRP